MSRYARYSTHPIPPTSFISAIVHCSNCSTPPAAALRSFPGSRRARSASMKDIAAAGEIKTKPTQHSVRELRAIGIQPDILLCRGDRPIPAELKRKIGLSPQNFRNTLLQMPETTP